MNDFDSNCRRKLLRGKCLQKVNVAMKCTKCNVRKRKENI